MYEKFIARQPIFDEKLKLFAYELLFPSSPENSVRPQREASNSLIVDSTMLLSTSTSPPSNGALRVSCPPGQVVLEILETIIPTPEVVQLCKELCASGYELALDDYVSHPKWEPLLPSVRFLMVDFRASDSDARADMVSRHKGNGIQFLAEKVETQAEVDEARALGYSLFQGYFFCKPSMVSAREIPIYDILLLYERAAGPR